MSRLTDGADPDSLKGCSEDAIVQLLAQKHAELLEAQRSLLNVPKKKRHKSPVRQRLSFLVTEIAALRQRERTCKLMRQSLAIDCDIASPELSSGSGDSECKELSLQETNWLEQEELREMQNALARHNGDAKLAKWVNKTPIDAFKSTEKPEERYRKLSWRSAQRALVSPAS